MAIKIPLIAETTMYLFHMGSNGTADVAVGSDTIINAIAETVVQVCGSSTPNC